MAIKEKTEFYCDFYLHLGLWCAIISIGTLRFIHVGRSTCSKGHQQKEDMHVLMQLYVHKMNFGLLSIKMESKKEKSR